MALILASASPRRRELLALIDPHFTVITADVDESGFACAEPRDLVGQLAAAKCLAVAQTHPGDCVIGCDTVVDVDGTVLGKPHSTAEAVAMLRLLSGRSHLVHTGVCVAKNGQRHCRVETTAVRFAPLSEEEIAAYTATPEPYDKAGGYGIQGTAARFVQGIDGCYFNVMGLPVRVTYQLLRQVGEL